MTLHRFVAPFAALLVLFALLLLVVTPAAADTVPNLVALTSVDRQVAVTYAALPNSTTLANAGAFASTMAEQYGMIAIANFDAATNADSYLVCEVPINADELLAVYGIEGQGVDEATALCQVISDNGADVRWR